MAEIDEVREIRDRLARRLRGRGIEIGAFSRPLDLNPALAKAEYVDCIDLPRMREVYLDCSDLRLVDPDRVIPEGDLRGIPDSSQDFVISCHVLEHIEDPLGALQEWHRVLRTGGTLFLAVPDMRFTGDRSRPRTRLSHLIRDHRDGGRSSRERHIREFGRAHLDLREEEEIRGFIERVDAIDYKIHFHAWMADDVREIVEYCRDEMGLAWEMEQMVEAGNEAILILVKGEKSE
jgi:SAM-dependent methyltransferase